MGKGKHAVVGPFETVLIIILSKCVWLPFFPEEEEEEEEDGFILQNAMGFLAWDNGQRSKCHSVSVKFTVDRIL